jgi:hypothetical protein
MKSKKIVMGALSVTLGIGALVGYSVERARASGIPATQAMSYSGVLTDPSGVPLTGSKNIQIQVFDMATGGNVQCTVGPTATALANGGFRLALPDTCTAAVHATPDLWIEVDVDGSSLGRTKLGAVPFAVEADHAKTADSATNATNATNAASAMSAMTATNATNATNATTAGSATTASNAGYAARLADYDEGVAGHLLGMSWDSSVLHFWVDVTNVVSLNGNGATKNFIIPHPTSPDRYLVHTTLEGPENAVYYRGTSHLQAGTAEISLPNYFEAAVRPEGRTILVTPKFASVTEPVSTLAASDVSNGVFLVRAIDDNNLSQAFDWEVKAIRADVEPLEPEPKRDDIVVHGDGPYKYFESRRPRKEKTGL